ncbi:unnamed protein product [Dibothriocephalus latus]|uniref:Protein kinase domain-containing protein n=1 Tax=Dibothriocephalus latus TaxID=60516 RepID=A0A3P7LC74_DIBLA|nr:unnamed protein product [Dibothriocephalus latus]
MEYLLHCFVRASANSQFGVFVSRLLGTPTEATWPGVTDLPEYKTFTVYPRNPHWHQAVPNLSVRGRDLLQQLLVCNPAERASADQALEHPYFDALAI